MWVEVVGLPGVGKTTMIEACHSFISSHYKVVESRKPSFLQRIIAKYLLFTYRKRTYDGNLAKKIAYRHSFRFLEKRTQPLFFYDSGIIQVILENLIETNFNDQKNKINLLHSLPLPDKVIVLQDNEHNIAEREVNRTRSRFKMDLSETVERYIKAQKLIEDTLLCKIKSVNIIKIENIEEFKKVLQSEKTS